jgi:hypothetical protein
MKKDVCINSTKNRGLYTRTYSAIGIKRSVSKDYTIGSRTCVYIDSAIVIKRGVCGDSAVGARTEVYIASAMGMKIGVCTESTIGTRQGFVYRVL